MTQAPNAILLPELVRIDAYLIDPGREYGFVEYDPDDERSKPDRIHLGTVFELSAASIHSWPINETDALPAQSVQIPERKEERYIAALYTSITVFGTHELGVRDSGLTLPKPIATDGALHGGETLQFSYRLGPRPAFDCLVSRGR